MRLVLLAVSLIALNAWPASAQVCAPWAGGPCYTPPPRDSGSSSGGGGDRSSRDDDDDDGGYSAPRVDRREVARSEAIQTANSWEATADRYLADRDYARAIEIYDKALKSYYTRARKKYYEGQKLRARRAWLDSKLAEVAVLNRSRRYDEIPALLEEAQRIWYTRELQIFIDQWKKHFADEKEAARNAGRLAERERARAEDMRRAFSSNNLPNAARLLDEAMGAYGVAPDRSLESSVVQAAAEVIGRDGVQAFAPATSEYRAYSANGGRMLSGSPEADQRYERLRRTAVEVPNVIQGLAPGSSAEPGLLEFARSLPAHLEELRRGDGRRAADEFRQAVLSSASRARIAPGEDDRVTIAFIKEMQQKCADIGDRSPFCGAGNARRFKNEGDPRYYVARRNAEHYLFTKEMVVAFGPLAPLGAASTMLASPLYSLVKYVWVGERFANSPGTVHEAGWGQRGAIVGLTGKLDPTK